MNRLCFLLTSALVAAVLAGCNRPDGFLDRDPLAQQPQTDGTIKITPARQAQPVTAAGAGRRVAEGFTVRRSQTPRPAILKPDPVLDGNAISLNLQDADISNVVRIIMDEGLGASYVLDPAVQGSVTFYSNRPLLPDQLLSTLEEILRLNNAAIINEGGIYRILPREQVGLAAPVLSARSIQSRGLVATVTPLRFVTVNDIAEVLDGFSPAAGAIRYDRARNLVFVTGTSAEQRTVQTLLATLDVNYFAGRSFALHPLREANADEVVQEMRILFASPSGADNPSIRFLPISRIDAVLVVADAPGLLNEALSLVRGLDQSFSNAPKLTVFPVSNRRAGEIAAALGQIFNVNVSGSSGSSGAVAPGLTPETTTTDSDADPNAGPPESPDFSLTSNNPGSTTPVGGIYRIYADDASNSIMALATGDGARALESALRRLDVQPLQVLIEATLLEVALNDRLEYGLRWFIQQGNFNLGFNDLVGAATFAPNALAAGGNAAFVTDDINVTVSALDAITDVRVLSSPTLMVLDNQSARLQVGDQVPITTRTAQSTDSVDAPLVAETQYRDTGVILEITPSVNASGLVVLNISQEISDVVETSGDVNPTFSQRFVNSTVALQSGQAVAIAGLIEESSSFGRDGIPVLSRIPVVGSAFGTTAERAERSELLILIRPIVVRNQADAQAATLELQRKLEGLRPRPAPPPTTAQ